MSTPTHYIVNNDLIKRLDAQSDITVSTLADRDAIQTWRRKWRMIVGVYNDGVNNGFYSLDYNKTSTDLSDNGNWGTIETDPVAMAAIGDRIYTEENHVTSGDTITKSVDDLDKAIDEFTGNTEELPTEVLPTEILPYPITANNHESLRYDTTTGQWIASNILLIKSDNIGIVTSTDNLAQKVAVIDENGNVGHVEKSTFFVPLKVKDPVAAATLGNITLLGIQTIDTVVLEAGDRVLVWKQTAPAENGIYVVAAGAWTRATDADEWDEFIQAYTLVLGGVDNLNVGFFCTAAADGTLETDPIHWVQFTKPGEFVIENVGTSVAVYKGLSGNTHEFRTLTSSNALLTITQLENTIDIDLDLSDYATQTYVDDRTKLYTFNATTDWTDVSGGHQIDFVHGLASKVSSEVMIGTDKLLVDTKEINNNTLRIYAPYGYRFAGEIKINK